MRVKPVMSEWHFRPKGYSELELWPRTRLWLSGCFRSPIASCRQSLVSSLPSGVGQRGAGTPGSRTHRLGLEARRRGGALLDGLLFGPCQPLGPFFGPRLCEPGITLGPAFHFPRLTPPRSIPDLMGPHCYQDHAPDLLVPRRRSK